VGRSLPYSILIVDDSTVVRRALQRLLGSRTGWEVCGEAVDGEDGIKQAERLKPDLMVLDMSMPGMDGIAVAKIMKVRMPQLPIIMFTNFAEDEFLKKEVMDSGITQLVSKSDSQGLFRAIEGVFKM